MSDEDHPLYTFLPGLDLSQTFYEKAVKPFMEEHYPDLVYSAVRIGHGSDVLGYDTAQSMDHDWGPKLQIFLKDSDYNAVKEEMNEKLRHKLPYEIRGFPTNFTTNEDGTLRMKPIDNLHYSRWRLCKQLIVVSGGVRLWSLSQKSIV